MPSPTLFRKVLSSARQSPVSSSSLQSQTPSPPDEARGFTTTCPFALANCWAARTSAVTCEHCMACQVGVTKERARKYQQWYHMVSLSVLKTWSHAAMCLGRALQTDVHAYLSARITVVVGSRGPCRGDGRFVPRPPLPRSQQRKHRKQQQDSERPPRR